MFLSDFRDGNNKKGYTKFHNPKTPRSCRHTEVTGLNSMSEKRPFCKLRSISFNIFPYSCPSSFTFSLTSSLCIEMYLGRENAHLASHLTVSNPEHETAILRSMCQIVGLGGVFR